MNKVKCQIFKIYDQVLPSTKILLIINRKRSNFGVHIMKFCISVISKKVLFINFVIKYCFADIANL